MSASFIVLGYAVAGSSLAVAMGAMDVLEDNTPTLGGKNHLISLVKFKQFLHILDKF